MTNDGRNAYLYDAEGRICVTWGPEGGTGYLYDAAGNRVAKGTINAWTCDMSENGFTQTEGYVVGLAGEQLTEVGATTSTWNHTNIYAGGKLIGTYDNNGLHFHFDDPLGTRRAQANASGLLEAQYQSLPFGDGYSASGSSGDDPTENHFTGKERDTETGNDYMFARYYNSATGRFLSPDWSAKHEPVPYAKLDSPQSLNLYGYVRNNPLSRTDADGHVDWSALGKGFAEVGRSLTIEASAGFGVGVKSSSLPGGGSFVGVGVFASSSGTKGIGAGYKADATVSQGQASGSQTARVYTMKDGEPIPVHDMQVEKDLPETKLGPVSTNGKEVIVGAEVGEGLSVGGQLSVDKELAKKGWDDMKASLKSAPPAAPAAPKKDQPDPKN